jgi:hypothetical protein
MKLLQVDIKGETVADLGPPVPDDAQTATLGGNVVVAQGAHVPPLRTAARPSLEVETEVHTHLVPRIEAHLRRIEGWDMRDLPQDHIITVETIAAIRENFRRLGEILHELNKLGFVAKSTAATRKRAALRPGTAVKLRPDIHADTVGLFYAEDELASLTVAKVGESSVLLVTAGGREIGPLPFAHVVMG